MSILDYQSKVIPDKSYKMSDYQMTDSEKATRALILRHFALGDVTMQKPRFEFNDLSVIGRMQVDMMSFNSYQANNGDPAPGDEINGWKSNAMRPIVRNKCISIAAHATAKLIFPKVFASDKESNDQSEVAKVMETLMEWTADKSDYSKFALNRVITAMYEPASIGFTEYCETYNKVKRKEDNDSKKWVWKKELDEENSGQLNSIIPCDQLYIENFYEPDIQKQGWLLLRRVIPFATAERKYKELYPNFEYVTPGVQIIFNDANQSFYQVYDTNMRQYDVEELMYWNKSLDLKIIMVNGVMLTDAENPNPRNDKLYPFDKFGYEPINNRCFYYKSLAFKMQQDANIINTLYPMIIDGTYLSMMPPMINLGGETIGADVIVPGQVTTLSDKDADLKALSMNTNLTAGLNTLLKVDESISQSSQDPLQSGNPNTGNQTAYEISRLEQNAQTTLGLFLKMIGQHVKDYGRLVLGDILQYQTIADVDKIEGGNELVYKTFLMNDKSSPGKSKKVEFTNEYDQEMNEEEMRLASYDVLEEEDQKGGDVELFKVNPKLFREMKYSLIVSPDILNPRSEDLERAYGLELYDRAIQNPIVDQEQITKDFLFGLNPASRKDPEKYIKEQQQPGAMGNPQDIINNQIKQPNNQSPMAAMGKQPLPQSMGSPVM